jgi:very-short-patch-repair endonuclease
MTQLYACGLSRDAVLLRARRGQLHRRHHGVYAVGHPNLTLEGEFLAAVKACGLGAVLSYYAAGAHWEMVEWDGRVPEVTVCDTTPRTHAGIRVHRTIYLDACDVRQRAGIPVTAPARTLVDLASLLSYEALRAATARALSAQQLSVADLALAVDRLGPRKGAAKLRRVLASRPAPTRSALEDVVLRLIDRADLSRPDVNLALNLDGRRVIPDFRWADRRLIVEADGDAWHDNKAAREADAERQALLEAHGERVLRVTWKQAVGKPSQVADRITAAYHRPHPPLSG